MQYYKCIVDLIEYIMTYCTLHAQYNVFIVKWHVIYY
jgi:hypothetical protein